MEGGQVGVYFEAAAVIVTLVLLGQVWSSARAVKPVRRFVHSWILLPKPPPGLRDDGDMKTHSMLVELDVNNPNQLLAPGMFAEVQKSLTIVGLLIAGETWNVSALVGLIGLFGIAVQNSLVLVAQTRAFLAEGRPFRDALREASIGRVGPKIMTAATAILGLLPLLVLRMHGTEIERPLAVVISAGLSPRRSLPCWRCRRSTCSFTNSVSDGRRRKSLPQSTVA